MDSNKNEIILESFSKFIIDSNLMQETCLNEILNDEVISMYIVNTIQQLFEQYDTENKWIDNKLEDAFEIENFIEIIDAYLNGFCDLEQTKIIQWLTQLKKSLDNNYKSFSEVLNQQNDEPIQKSSSLTDNDVNLKQNVKKINSYEPDVLALSEMFPSLNLKEINIIYKKTNNNYERSIDELLLLQEEDALVVDYDDDDDKLDLNDDEKKALKERTVKQ